VTKPSPIIWRLAATAAALSFSLEFSRVVRRIFVSLGVLIAADGISMLFMAVIIR
jgi:hypothetical protein